MKTHSEIAHQHGAFKICLMMTSGEMGQYWVMNLHKMLKFVIGHVGKPTGYKECNGSKESCEIMASEVPPVIRNQ